MVVCGKICIGEQPEFYIWRLGRLDPVYREVRPYDDIGVVNVQYCIMPVDCNGTCSVSGQVTVI